MKKYKLRDQNAITLVALVVTIIILLILAGVAISQLGEIGLFGKANTAKEEHEISRAKEKLEMEIDAIQVEYKGTATLNNVYEEFSSDDQLEIDVIELEETATTSVTYNGGRITYMLVEIYGYAFELTEGDEGIQIGEGVKADSLQTIIKITSTTNTTNSITVNVSTISNAGGTIKYYIKKQSEEDSAYELKATTNNSEKTYTFTGLEQNVTYTVKVEAISKNNETVDATVDKTTGTVDAATSTNLTSSTTWNGANATVTFSTDTSYQIQYSTDASTWTTGNSVTVSSGTTVYARLYDGKNAGIYYEAATPILSYNIEYNLNAETAGESQPTTANYGETIQISKPTRSGYKFAGWTATNLSTGTAYYGTNSSEVTTAWNSTGTKPTAEFYKNLSNSDGTTITLKANWNLDGNLLEYPVITSSGIFNVEANRSIYV